MFMEEGEEWSGRSNRNRHIIFSTCRPNNSGVWAASERDARLIGFKARSEGNVQKRQFCVLEGTVERFKVLNKL